jgi:tartrate dehydrogenase/decarboxylase / D-malate dehydrogenase
MKTYKIACIPGDGIGKEVVPAGQAVLEALARAQGGFAFQFSSFAGATTGFALTAHHRPRPGQPRGHLLELRVALEHIGGWRQPGS